MHTSEQEELTECHHGDFISLSDVCDKSTALVIKREVSDGVIAPGYTDEALEILKAKKKGNYCVIEIDPSYEPAPIERKDVFGITFEQGRNELHIDDDFGLLRYRLPGRPLHSIQSWTVYTLM